jgi:rSAM/selenodomain-associated transferase 1
MKATALALFVKAARPGEVKTRLAPPLTPEAACAMHRAFAEDLLALTSGLPVERWVFTNDTTDPFVSNLARGAGVPLHEQHPGDLGDRMLDALERLTPLHQGVVILGSDCPTVPLAFLHEATKRARAGLVLGPAVDGGYYLIGAPRPVPELFSEMPWSGPAVLAETMNRVSRSGEPLHLLPFWYDVDDAEALALLRAHLGMLPPEVAPATRAALRGIAGHRTEAQSPKLTAPEEPL